MLGTEENPSPPPIFSHPPDAVPLPASPGLVPLAPCAVCGLDACDHEREAPVVLTKSGKPAAKLVPVDDDATIERSSTRTSRLNAALVAHAATSGDIGVLASPVTGGGVAVDRVEQLFCGAIAAGHVTPESWTTDAIARVTAAGGADPGDAAALARGARRFASQRLPVLRALGVVAG